MMLEVMELEQRNLASPMPRRMELRMLRGPIDTTGQHRPLPAPTIITKVGVPSHVRLPPAVAPERRVKLTRLNLELRGPKRNDLVLPFAAVPEVAQSVVESPYQE